MIPAITSVLGWLSPKKLAYLLVAGLLTFAAVQGTRFVNQALEDRTRLTILEIENQSLEENLRTRQFLLDQQRQATEAAERALEAEKKRAAEFDGAQNDVDNAADTDDGQIAPVLDNALEFIRNRRP